MPPYDRVSQQRCEMVPVIPSNPAMNASSKTVARLASLSFLEDASVRRLSLFADSCWRALTATTSNPFAVWQSHLTSVVQDIALRRDVCYTLSLSAPSRGIVSPGQRGILFGRQPAARSLFSLTAERSASCPP